MPFLAVDKIGEGATGDVFKALIASKYFLYEQGHQNPKPIWVAIKKIQRSDQIKLKNFTAEQKALRVFKQCLRKHENIMHSFMSFTHGDDFVIISPLADLDLAAFFTGDYGEFKSRQRHFTPKDLFQEAACLAGALNFLHNGLELRGSKIACAHLDFKPDNVLVRWTYNSQSTSVGQWLIHDFGTSKIKESAEENSPLAPGDFLTRFSLTKAQRSPSTFQAPEVQNSTDRITGRESDMWSFGCIIAIALAFALGGPRYATDLLGANYESTKSDRVPNDWFYTKVNGRVTTKEATFTWLNDRATERPEDRWVARIINLVFKMLAIKPTDRLNAEQAQDQLHFICSEESLRMEELCRWPKPSSPAPADAQRTTRDKAPDPGLHPVDAPLDHQNSQATFPMSQIGDLNLNPMSNHNYWQPQSNVRPHPTPYSPPNSWYGPSSPPRGQDYQRRSIASPDSQYSTGSAYGQSPTSPWNPSYSSLGFDIPRDHKPAPARRNPSIVRSDTNTFTPVYNPPATPTVSTLPRSTSRSNQSEESSSLNKGAKRSSSGGQVTFANLATPQGSLKSIVCGISARVAFMSRTSVVVHNFRYHNTWAVKKPQKIPDSSTFGFYPPKPITYLGGFEWDLITLCGDWLVLRAMNGADCRILRYHCSRSNLDNLGVALEFWTETPFSTTNYDVPAADAVNGIAGGVLEVKVNLRGDVLFMFHEDLCLYSSSMGFHSLEIVGQLRRACFSSDGTYIFAWTKSTSRTHGGNVYQNRWYMWHINSTASPLLNETSPWTAALRPGKGKDSLLFPFSNYFAAFEIPDRLYIVGKDRANPVIQLQSPVESISAGVSYDVTYEPEFPDSTSQRLILVQQDSNPRILGLPLLPQVRSSTPSKLQDLQLGFDTKTHGMAITRDEKGTYIVVSHPKGVIERRALLI